MSKHETLNRLEDIICKEIEDTISDGKAGEPKLGALYKAIDILKDIGEIREEDMGYSNGMPDYIYDNSYARRRDSIGRYSRDNSYRGNSYGGNSYAERGNSYADRGNSYDTDMIASLERIMQRTQNDADREDIRKMIRQMRG